VIGLWLPAVAWMAAIYIGAVLPSTPAPASGFRDTYLHMAAYSGLALLLLRALAGGRWSGVTPRTLLLALVLASLHGASVEIEQMFTPTRLAEWRDLGSDVIGAAVALLPAWVWSKIKG
jgi:VanZ family protein